MPDKTSTFLAVFLVFLIWLVFPGMVLAADGQPNTNSYLLINQIRGQECCSEGSVTALSQQIEATVTSELSAYFALRYDALQDSRFVTEVLQAQNNYPEFIKPALLFEITPQLAFDSRVSYPGKIETWYKSNQVFTLGYEQQDRQALIDQLMQTYKSVFGEYPEVTSSWMIDTDSLNYLHDMYGVEIHQITREQWGIDSYSLHGGPVHYPYPASRNWLFMPDYSATNSALVVRQTLSDPLRNYGDLTSAFTSQPNDYILDNKNFNYFEKLADQSLNENNFSGFMLLGLENSMNDWAHAEYQKQLEWLSQQVKKGRITGATTTSLNDLYRISTVKLLTGKDLVEQTNTQVFWVMAGQYRIRMLVSGAAVRITDVRLYDPGFTDPYTDVVAHLDGFWVTPFLVDSSLTQDVENRRPWWKELLLHPIVHSSRMSPQSDLNVQTNFWKLPDTIDANSFKTEQTGDSLRINYESAQGKVAISFKPEEIVFEGVNDTDMFGLVQPNEYFPVQINLKQSQHQIHWPFEDGVAYSASLVPTEAATDDSFTMQFFVRPERWKELLERYYYYFFPEMKLVDSPDPEKTIFYVHNRYAIAGRNPVRFVLAPKDKQGVPVGLSTAPQVTTDTPVVVSDTAKNKIKDVQFIDVTSAQPAKVQTRLEIGSDFQRRETIFFSPNCGEDILTCMRNPEYFYWFARVKISDKLFN